MVPDPTQLIEALALREPLIGLYDAPEPAAFAPLVEPRTTDGHAPCVFSYRSDWLAGRTLHLTAESGVCGGALRSLFGVQTSSREEFITFLYEEEGLRASRELMEEMIDAPRGFACKHGHVLIGPLKPQLGDHLRTVTFYVNPDQLSILQHGAYYHWSVKDPAPVVVPFSSGCGELLGGAGFHDLETAQAAVGSTDIAMRSWLPRDLLAFTVTMPMFARLCALDHRSFLGKGFLARLKEARGASWGAACAD